MGSPPTPTDWSWWGHVTYFWNFWTSSLSRERFELQTSNLACRLVTGDTNNKNEKLGQKAGKGSRDATFEILGPRAGFTLSDPCLEKNVGTPPYLGSGSSWKRLYFTKMILTVTVHWRYLTETDFNIIQQSHCMFAIDMFFLFICESVDVVYSLTNIAC